jgi:hypothetical protein
MSSSPFAEFCSCSWRKRQRKVGARSCRLSRWRGRPGLDDELARSVGGVGFAGGGGLVAGVRVPEEESQSLLLLSTFASASRLGSLVLRVFLLLLALLLPRLSSLVLFGGYVVLGLRS